MKTHMRNCIKNKKFQTNFKSSGVSKPLIMYLFGNYDGQTKFGKTLNLNWNAKHTSFNTAKFSSTDYAPTWSMDAALTSFKNVQIFYIIMDGKKHRYYELTYIYSISGSFNVQSKWKFTYLADKNGEWQQCV